MIAMSDMPQGPNLAALQSMNLASSTGDPQARLLGVLPSLTYQSPLAVNGKLWQPISIIGGKGGKPNILQALFGGAITGDFPAQMSVGEYMQMISGDVQQTPLVDAGANGSFVGPPSGGGASGGGDRSIDI